MKHSPIFLPDTAAASIPLSGNRGGAMLGAVIAILVVGALGAGIVSMISTSAYHEVRANHGQRAFYLAESGYRYALSVYRQADSANKTTALQNLNGVSKHTPGGGQFILKEVQILHEDHPRVFTIDGNQTIGTGDNILRVKDESGLEQYNNAFEVGGMQYRYLEYQKDESRLVSIRPISPETSLPAEFSDGENATAVTSLRMVSRGEFPGSGFFNVAREITYWQPLYSGPLANGEPAFGRDSTFIDKGTSLEDWKEGPGETGKGDPLGDYEAEEIDDNSALHLKHVGPGNGHDRGKGGKGRGHGEGGQGSQPFTSIFFQPEDGSRIESSDYEVQVKIKLGGDEDEEAPEHYMAGITFRKQTGTHTPGNLPSYGISFIRGERGENGGPPGNKGAVPNDLLPLENTAMVVLWRLNSNPNSRNAFTRLAWAPIPQLTTSVVDDDGILKDWSTLLVRVEQRGNPGAEYNRITAMYGDQENFSYTGDDDPFNHVRISSWRLPDDSGYDLPWPPNDVSAWNAEKDFFTLIEWGPETGGGAVRNNRTIAGEEKDIGIHTAPEEYLFTGGELEVGLHTWGKNLEENVWFDDFAVREARPGSGSGGPAVLPIQR